MVNASTTRRSSSKKELPSTGRDILDLDAVNTILEPHSRSEYPEQTDIFMMLKPASDWSVKDDMSSMEFPIFSLSKNIDTRIRVYSRAGKTVRIIPSAVGAATVFDKDILIYCISQMVKATDVGLPVNRRVRIEVYPFLASTKRSCGGASYERVIDMCRRLKGTTIETNVRTTDVERTHGFSLIEDYSIVQYTASGKGALELELTISDWLYRAVVETDILTLSPAYFSLTQPFERRIYELGRKHCGHQAWFTISLGVLREKVGSQQIPKEFNRDLRALVKRNGLPDYHVALDASTKPEQFVFISRDSKKVFLEGTRKDRLGWVCQLLQGSMPLLNQGKSPSKQ